MALLPDTPHSSRPPDFGIHDLNDLSVEQKPAKKKTQNYQSSVSIFVVCLLATVLVIQHLKTMYI